jgi:flagellar biosynthesis chaperone FliJ
MDVNEIFEDGEELQEQKKPSLEDIKKIVDSKRLKGTKPRTPSKTYTKEDRIKNLEIAREKKKNEIKPISIPEPKQEQIQPKKISVNKSVENLNTSSPIINHTFNNEINELKQLIISQNEILEKLKKEVRPKTIRKPKTENQKHMKTLDLTITDNDIKNIIENNSNSNNSNISNKKIIEDPKLKMFLDALKRV